MSRAATLKHVLVIDDDPILCELLRAFFEGHGVSQVSIAADGDEARKIFDANAATIDLISSDLHMPGTNGIEFLQHLKETGSQIPFLIISSAHDSVVESAGILAKTYGLNLISTVNKPINTAKLEAVLADYLET